MPALFYPAIVRRSPGGFTATFPDLPSCGTTTAETIQEAALSAGSALAVHVEQIENGAGLPAPSSLDDIRTRVEQADEVACVLIRADVPRKVEQVIISLDTGILRAIDAVAPDRSAWIAQAVTAALTGPASAAPETTLTYQRIESLIRERPGLTESEIARELFGPKGYQQKVNPDCRWLVQIGRLVRSATRPARYYLPNSRPDDIPLGSAASRRPAGADRTSFQANSDSS